jgi:D-alanine-D-alanine ligase
MKTETHNTRVAVLMGGDSAEREISLRSGQAVLEALQQAGVSAHGIDLQSHNLHQKMSEQTYDQAFIMVHGRSGEDGTLQGALEHLNIPYTGSGVLGSALGMDKARCKAIWQAQHLPTPKFRCIKDHEKDTLQTDELTFPVIIKPVHEGSSIGMQRVESLAQLNHALDEAFGYDNEVLIEQWVDGPEYTVAILQDRALPVIRLETPHAFYDYAAKYQADSTRYLCPCGLDPADEKYLQDLALTAFQAVGCSGWGRVDILCNSQGEAFLIEVNTVPGMTDHSLVPMAAKHADLSFQQLVLKILETAS